MDLSPELFLLVCSLLIFCSIIISKVSVRFGVPVLLLFLFVGMLSGIDGLGIHYSHVSSAQHIGTIALCIILFSGGMNTSIKEIKPILWQGITLSTVGVLLTTIFRVIYLLVSRFAKFIFKLYSSGSNAVSSNNVVYRLSLGIQYIAFTEDAS